MTTADKLICSLKISTDQIVLEVGQFEAAVSSKRHRREAAQLIADTIQMLSESAKRLNPSIDCTPVTITNPPS